MIDYKERWLKAVEVIDMLGKEMQTRIDSRQPIIFDSKYWEWEWEIISGEQSRLTVWKKEDDE